MPIRVTVGAQGRGVFDRPLTAVLLLIPQLNKNWEAWGLSGQVWRVLINPVYTILLEYDGVKGQSLPCLESPSEGGSLASEFSRGPALVR